MKIWRFIAMRLEAGEEVALLHVTHSKGSSPGRKGFAMAIATDGEMAGSIGGGVMELRLVELAKSRLRDGIGEPISRRLVHRADAGSESSGLICSGEQTVEIRLLTAADDLGQLKSETANTVCIIGGGHVGLAVSEIMARLGFRVEIFDDRPSLNTIEQNRHAHDVHLLEDFANLASLIPTGQQVYIVVVTFGFQVDRVVMRQLIGREFAYLGMMGSHDQSAQTLRRPARRWRDRGGSRKSARAHRHPDWQSDAGGDRRQYRGRDYPREKWLTSQLLQRPSQNSDTVGDFFG